MMKQKFCKIYPFKFNLHNGYFSGFNLKRGLTYNECKYILSNLLGIVPNTKDDCDDKDEWNDYKQEVTDTVNDWLKGSLDDTAIQELSYDCSDEPLGMFNAINIVMYLQKKKVI